MNWKAWRDCKHNNCNYARGLLDCKNVAVTAMSNLGRL